MLNAVTLSFVVAAAAVMMACPVALASDTIQEITHREKRFVLYNSRRLTGECLDVCVPTPTADPTGKPTTANPTDMPTGKPTTANPTDMPTGKPTTANPTANPTGRPTTANPTDMPTGKPTTANPTENPTGRPTTANPTENPTGRPTTANPTANPTGKPTTANPTANPTGRPTTANPTANPTGKPTTANPTAAPGINPGSFCHALGEGCGLTGPGSCAIQPGPRSGEYPHGTPSCGIGVPAGYYPDLTRCDAYCKCTGTAAPSRYEIVNTGLHWDHHNDNSYLPGKWGKNGGNGAYGTTGGTTVHIDGMMSYEGTKRPPNTCGPPQKCNGPNDNKTHAYNGCKQFFQCSKGRAYQLQSCAPGTLYDEKLKICNHSYAVTCGVP